MIHLSTYSPFYGHDQAFVFGKGPSFTPVKELPSDPCIGINEAALKLPVGSWGCMRDWTVADRMPRPGRKMRRWLVEQRVWGRGLGCSWVQRSNNRYFDGKRVIGTDVPSLSVPGRTLGVGTATAVLQILAEAGVRRVYLNGFDNFFGVGAHDYHEVFVKMGRKPGDYAKEFPASGTVEEQMLMVRESMQYVIDKKGLEVHAFTM